jgi:hypothetical protein
MNPKELAGQGNGDPASFLNKGEPRFVGPSGLDARKVMVEYFNGPGHYQEWMEKNPYIEVISVIDHNYSIVLTYKEPR